MVIKISKRERISCRREVWLRWKSWVANRVKVNGSWECFAQGPMGMIYIPTPLEWRREQMQWRKQ